MPEKKKEYKSKDPVVQQCLDILDNPEVACKKVGRVIDVNLGSKTCFSICACALFIEDTAYAIANNDINALVKKIDQIKNSRKALTHSQQFDKSYAS